MSWDPKLLGNVAEWLAVLAILAGFCWPVNALIRQRFVESALAFDRRYKDHRDYITTFWDTLRGQYKDYRDDELE